MIKQKEELAIGIFNFKNDPIKLKITSYFFPYFISCCVELRYENKIILTLFIQLWRVQSGRTYLFVQKFNRSILKWAEVISQKKLDRLSRANV